MTELNLVFDDLYPITKQHGQSPRAMYNAKAKKWVGTMYPNQKYHAFKEEVGWLAIPQIRKQNWIMLDKQKLSASVLIYWPEKTRFPDIIDNALSGIFDALEGMAYKNDGKFREFYVKRIDTTFKKRIRIVIRKLEDVRHG